MLFLQTICRRSAINSHFKCKTIADRNHNYHVGRSQVILYYSVFIKIDSTATTIAAWTLPTSFRCLFSQCFSIWTNAILQNNALHVTEPYERQAMQLLEWDRLCRPKTIVIGLHSTFNAHIYKTSFASHCLHRNRWRSRVRRMTLSCTNTHIHTHT